MPDLCDLYINVHYIWKDRLFYSKKNLKLNSIIILWPKRSSQINLCFFMIQKKSHIHVCGQTILEENLVIDVIGKLIFTTIIKILFCKERYSIGRLFWGSCFVENEHLLKVCTISNILYIFIHLLFPVTQ